MSKIPMTLEYFCWCGGPEDLLSYFHVVLILENNSSNVISWVSNMDKGQWKLQYYP